MGRSGIKTGLNKLIEKTGVEATKISPGKYKLGFRISHVNKEIWKNTTTMRVPLLTHALIRRYAELNGLTIEEAHNDLVALGLWLLERGFSISKEERTIIYEPEWMKEQLQKQSDARNRHFPFYQR